MRGVWAKESRSVLRMDHTVVTIEIMQSCRDTNKNEIPEYTLQYSQHFLQSITSSNVLAVLVCVKTSVQKREWPIFVGIGFPSSFLAYDSLPSTASLFFE